MADSFQKRLRERKKREKRRDKEIRKEERKEGGSEGFTVLSIEDIAPDLIDEDGDDTSNAP